VLTSVDICVNGLEFDSLDIDSALILFDSGSPVSIRILDVDDTTFQDELLRYSDQGLVKKAPHNNLCGNNSYETTVDLLVYDETEKHTDIQGTSLLLVQKKHYMDGLSDDEFLLGTSDFNYLLLTK